jgi:hypothetical protein
MPPPSISTKNDANFGLFSECKPFFEDKVLNILKKGIYDKSLSAETERLLKTETKFYSERL